jgi:hypothetical protein
MSKLLLEDQYPTHYLPGVGRQVMAAGGESIEGDVQFAPDGLPTFAQPQTQEVTQALDVARAVPKKEYAPFGVLPLKETDEGIKFDPYAGLLGSVTRPAKYFYETMSGQKEMDPTSDEAIRAATDLAGAITGGSTAFERPAGAIASGASRPGMGHNMPPEAMAAERVTNPLGMHSAAAEVARNLPQQTGTIEQMLAMIKNKVNPEELHWSGVAGAFQPGQKVTAEELAGHFESKLPQVQETLYGGTDFEPKYGSIDWNPQQWQNAIRRAEMNRDFDLSEALMNEWETAEGLGAGVKAPKYPDLNYRTPGGTNYREIVLHHPVARVEDPTKRKIAYQTSEEGSISVPMAATHEQIQQMKDKGFIINDMGPVTVPGPSFTEAHHEEPNIVGHLRMSDMTGPEGEKILNVHEFQSDWGQKIRKHGVITGKETEDKAALDRKQEELWKRIADEVNQIKKEALEKYKQAGFDELVARGTIDRQSPVTLAQLARGMDGANAYMKLIEENAQLHDDIGAMSARKPAAPYVSSREGQHNTPGWTDLLIKRVMQEAEKGGYDKVVWDTPREQGQRYMNMPNIVKGMQGYYGDVLPRRLKKVVPEAKLGEHDVGAPQSKIDFSLHRIGENVPGSDTALWAAKEEHPDLNNEQLLRVTGLYDDFMIVEAAQRGIELPDVMVRRAPRYSEGAFELFNKDSGESISLFDSEEEASAAANTYLAQKAEEAIGSGSAKRPGFVMTPELKERVRKGFSAYRRGGEVEDAIEVAKSVVV